MNEESNLEYDTRSLRPDLARVTGKSVSITGLIQTAESLVSLSGMQARMIVKVIFLIGEPRDAGQCGALSVHYGLQIRLSCAIESYLNH